MKISTKGRYGVRILLDLALHDGQAPRQIRDIAISQQMSEKYISQLVIDLRHAKIIRSSRGSLGGYRMARNPAEITLLDIVEAMEGPLSVVGCVTAPEICSRNRTCPSQPIWNRLNTGIREAMRQITLQDMIDSCGGKPCSEWTPETLLEADSCPHKPPKPGRRSMSAKKRITGSPSDSRHSRKGSCPGHP